MCLLLYWLGDVDAQVVFSSSADVESQAELVLRQMQVNRSTQRSIWAVHRDGSVRFLHHHPPMDQIHPKHTNTHAEDLCSGPQSARLGWWHSPGGLLVSVTKARHASQPLDEQTETSVTHQHLHSAAHADVLQTHAVHLQQLITDTQTRQLYTHTHTHISVHTHTHHTHQCTHTTSSTQNNINKSRLFTICSTLYNTYCFKAASQ